MNDHGVPQTNVTSTVPEPIPEQSLSNTIVEPNHDITEAITSLSNNLTESVAQLSSTLSSLHISSDSITFTQLMFACFVAFVGAFSAYLFNLFHWRVLEKKKKISNIGVQLTTLINELESIAVQYWLHDYAKERLQQSSIAEISIISKLRLITRYIGLITPELKKGTTASGKQKLEDFGLDIFDLITGDEFESIDRKASKPKAMKISKKCSDIRAVISSLAL